MSTKPDIQTEEIDLGNLFQQIGNMFRSFFTFIGNIFSFIYHKIIVFILFLRKYKIILGSATLLGIIIGFFVGKDKKTTFSSDMFVEVGYNSGNHVYKQIDYLNQLLIKGDAAKFSEIFNLKPEEVYGVSGFKIEPIDDVRQLHLMYDEFQNSIDTAYTRTIEFENFSKRITEKDFLHYKIEAFGKNQTIFPKLNDSIVVFFENDFFKQKRDSKIKELVFEKAILKKEINQIDSLRKRYKETAYLAMQRKVGKNSGVSFNTTNKQYKGNLDLDLFHQSDTLRTVLRELNEEIINSDYVVKVESDFKIGAKDQKILSISWVRYGLFGFLLSFLILIGIHFNRYLTHFEKRITT